MYGIWTKGGYGGRTRRWKELVCNRRIGYLKTETSLPLCEKAKHSAVHSPLLCVVMGLAVWTGVKKPEELPE
jgi:hypothetical protein